MKYNFLPLVLPVAALLFSCGSNKDSEASTKDTTVMAITDTVVQTVTESVDTAAIIAEYEAAYAKTKSTDKKPVYKEKEKKQVAVYTEPVIESKAPVHTQPATNTRVADTADAAGFNYKADKNATYPGGQKAWDQYFYKNFEYPHEALENGAQGTIYAEIFINEKGFVERVDFPGHKLGYGLEEEARRVIMATKQLDPAIKKGVPAKERYVLPIRVMIKE